MHCSRCHAQSRDGAKFCEDCGSRLAVRCSSCGSEVTAGKRFCGTCGHPIEHGPTEPRLAARIALDGEHKLLTVLFCDIVNSTGLAERLGAEQMHGLLNRFFERALSEVHRYEGTINQFLGDGFMALFGAPVAHEDHARRAVLAAFGIQQAIGERAEVKAVNGEALTLRMGLNTGPVVAGTIGDQLRTDYTAVGDTTNLAARLQQLAEPGTILVSDTTARLVTEDVEMDALGALQIKGKTDSIQGYRVTAIRPRRSSRHGYEHRNLSAFVGRDRELRTLHELLGLAEGGQGQLVGIVGEAGVGKSRLVHEFRRSLTERRATFQEVHCFSYDRAVPYLPLIDLLREGAQITPRDSTDVAVTRVRRTLEELGLEADVHAPFLLRLLGIDEGTERLAALTPDRIKSGIFEALCQMTLMSSKKRPIVILAEDLHWIDATSEEFVQLLADAVPGAAMLLLMTYRPGYRPPRLEKSCATQLALRSLSTEDSRRIVSSAARDETMDATVVDTILGKAEGNAFFLEELTRAVLEQKTAHAGSPTVPGTVQAVLAARIDRLDDDTKRVLQAAAVLGREFSPRLVEQMWDGAGSVSSCLKALQTLEFLYERMSPDNPTLVFQHALTQEVAFSTLLNEHRRILHGRAVSAIEHVFRDRLGPHLDSLARHALAADLPGRAVEYLHASGTALFAKGAVRDSLERLDQALEMVSRLEPTVETTRRSIDLRLDLHSPLFVIGDLSRVTKLHEEAEALARELGDHARLGRVLVRLANYSWAGAHYADARHRSTQALTIGLKTGDRVLAVMGRYLLGEVQHACGEYPAAIRSFRENVEGDNSEVAKQRLGFTASPYVVSCGYLAWCYALLGDFQSARAFGDRAVASADASNEPQARVYASLLYALMLDDTGDSAQGIEWCERARTQAEGQASAWIGGVYSVLGYLLVQTGRVAEGLGYQERALAHQERIGFRVYRPLFRRKLAEGLLAAGQVDQAKHHAEAALEAATESGERGHEAYALYALGLATADEHPLHRARTLAETLGMRPLVARCHMELGTFHARAGRLEPAREHLTIAATMFRDMDMRFRLETAEQQIKELA